MSKVEIDLEVLTKALSVAITEAVKIAVTPTPSTKKPKITKKKTIVKKEEKIKIKKEAGRPKKVNSEIIQNEEVEEIQEDEKPINPRRSSYLAPAKRNEGLNVEGKNPTKTKIFSPPKKPNKFIDTGDLCKGDKVESWKYPERSERRDPVKKMKFQCDICDRSFEAFPSEVPQAFSRLGDGREAERPIVRCEGCLGMPKMRRNNYE